jgi:hypothetical protein
VECAFHGGTWNDERKCDESDGREQLMLLRYESKEMGRTSVVGRTWLERVT